MADNTSARVTLKPRKPRTKRGKYGIFTGFDMSPVQSAKIDRFVAASGRTMSAIMRVLVDRARFDELGLGEVREGFLLDEDR